MQKLILVLALAFLLPTFSLAAQTRDLANNRARALIAKMKAHPQKLPVTAAAPLLNLSSSPQIPLQNRALTWVVQFDNPFTNRLLSIEAKNNNQAVSNIQSPYKGMFVVSLGLMTEARASNLEITLFAEDPQTNLDTRNAVKALDTDVRRLTGSINIERDAAKRRILQIQRDEKLALKNELLEQLKKFRFKLGTQSLAYNVAADSGSTTNPRITNISPISGNVRGGNQVTISGANFSSNVEVKFAGLAATNINFINETTITAVTPDFGAGNSGAKDLELRFTTNQGVFNVNSPAAFFAANITQGPIQKPVAVASGSQKVRLGDSAQLDGGQSYAGRETNISYKWTLVSAPSNSNFAVGQILSTAVTPTFTPDAYGAFLLQLVVREVGTDELLESDPSLVIVQADGGPQPVAGPIIVGMNGSGTTQVVANDPTPGDSINFSISQQPSHGSASVSSLGIVSYQPSLNYVGADSLIVRATDQSGLYGNVAISITVTNANLAPLPSAAAISTHSEPGSTQVFANDPNGGSNFSYIITSGPNHGAATIAGNGLVSYASTSGYVGQDEIVVDVTDGGFPLLTGQVTISINVSANSTPTVSAGDIVVTQGQTPTTQASVVDDAGQTGAFSATSPSYGTASVSSTGLVTYTPGFSFSGSDSFSVSFTDNGSPALSGSKVITVYANDPPVASAPGITLATGGTASSQITASDPNAGQILSFSLIGAPSHGSASVNASGLVSYSSTAGYTGLDSIWVLVADNGTPQMSTSVQVQVTIEPNHAPTATAPSITSPANGSATSQISAIDQDVGQVLSYAITSQPNNGSATVSSSGLVTFQSNSPLSSSSSIGVSITDNGTPNLAASITIPVTVEGVNNQPPIIPDPLFYTIRSQGIPVQVSLNLSGNALPVGGIVDPDGTLASITWDFGDGTQEKTFDAAQGQIFHNYVAFGTYTATLTATDNYGASSTRQLTVNVVDTDVPTAKFTVSPSNGGGGVLPLTVTFNASGATDSSGITQYRWRWAANGTEEITTSPTIAHTFTTAGTYSVRLRTRDANFAQGEATVNVTAGSTVTGSPVQAQFTVGPPREVIVGTAHAFSGARSFNPNVGGALIAYNWNFGNFSTCPNPNGGCTGTGISTSYTYPFVGNYFPSLQVQSGNGSLSNRVNQEVFAVNTGHAPKAIARYSAIAGVAPFALSVDGTESFDYEGSISNYSWFFSDLNGTPVSGATAQHTFSAPGAYFATLQVRDSDNNTHSFSQAITVTASRSEAKALRAKRRSVPYDPEREYQRQIFSGACVAGDGEACSSLADMYAEDGDSFTAERLKARACELGYSAACVSR